MGFFSSSKDKAVEDDPNVVAFRQQIEMMNSVFMLSLRECKSKCIERENHHTGPDLTRGEALCVKRCGEKLFSALELVSAELAKGGGLQSMSQ